MADRYRDFADLAAHETEGQDYAIEVLVDGRVSDVLVMAPHGGGIEPNTCRLAREIAGEDLTFYAFKGIKPGRGNKVLHITSHRFDEPRALELAQEANVVLAIHGKSGSGKFMMVGGRNTSLVNDLVAAVNGLIQLQTPTSSVAGSNPKNICNRCRCGGAQFELSRGLRSQLARAGELRRTFVHAVRRVLLSYV